MSDQNTPKLFSRANTADLLGIKKASLSTYIRRHYKDEDTSKGLTVNLLLEIAEHYSDRTDQARAVADLALKHETEETLGTALASLLALITKQEEERKKAKVIPVTTGGQAMTRDDVQFMENIHKTFTQEPHQNQPHQLQNYEHPTPSPNEPQLDQASLTTLISLVTELKTEVREFKVINNAVLDDVYETHDYVKNDSKSIIHKPKQKVVPVIDTATRKRLAKLAKGCMEVEVSEAMLFDPNTHNNILKRKAEGATTAKLRELLSELHSIVISLISARPKVWSDDEHKHYEQSLLDANYEENQQYILSLFKSEYEKAHAEAVAKAEKQQAQINEIKPDYPHEKGSYEDE